MQDELNLKHVAYQPYIIHFCPSSCSQPVNLPAALLSCFDVTKCSKERAGGVQCEEGKAQGRPYRGLKEAAGKLGRDPLSWGDKGTREHGFTLKEGRFR